MGLLLLLRQRRCVKGAERPGGEQDDGQNQNRHAANEHPGTRSRDQSFPPLAHGPKPGSILVTGHAYQSATAPSGRPWTPIAVGLRLYFWRSHLSTSMLG